MPPIRLSAEGRIALERSSEVENLRSTERVRRRSARVQVRMLLISDVELRRIGNFRELLRIILDDILVISSI